MRSENSQKSSPLNEGTCYFILYSGNNLVSMFLTILVGY